MNDCYDFIVIGSGFGGSVAALRLSEKGYRVMVLEKGKRYGTPDFPKTNWNLRKYLWLPSLGLYGIQKLSFYRKASILSGVGVGGGSLVYANTLYVPPPEFFRQGPWADLADWEKILEPYYQKAGDMLGRVQYNDLHVEDEVLLEVAREMGRENTFQAVHVGVFLGDREKETDPYFDGKGPLRKGCTECAGCMVGCRENAKNTLDKNYLYFAQKNGLRIEAETKAEKIEYTGGSYLVHTRKGTSALHRQKRVFRAGALIIAAGTLGSLELLLKQKFKYKTLLNLSPRLGEELRTNAETLCAVSGASMKLNNGLAITSVFHPDSRTHVEVVKYPDGSNAMKWFFSLSVKNARHPLLRLIRLTGKTLTHPWQFLRTAFNFHWSGSLVILLVMQSVDNAMRMVWGRSLWGGKMKIVNSGSRRVPAYIPVAQDILESYARKVSGVAQNIILEVAFDRPTTAHILGGCPMSETTEAGVIDQQNRVHGYPNMWIADGSAIQGNLGVNPSLTIAAMAEYVMDTIPHKNTS